MIVLDTHIWLWWINADQMRPGPRVLKALSRLVFLPFPALKFAWLAHHGRIDLPCAEEAWFEKALDGSGITLLPITARIARIAVPLPEHHRDPQDRLIIATALTHDATPVSMDDKFPL